MVGWTGGTRGSIAGAGRRDDDAAAWMHCRRGAAGCRRVGQGAPPASQARGPPTPRTCARSTVAAGGSPRHHIRELRPLPGEGAGRCSAGLDPDRGVGARGGDSVARRHLPELRELACAFAGRSPGLVLAVAVFAVSWGSILARLCQSGPLHISFYRVLLTTLLLTPFALQSTGWKRPASTAAPGRAKMALLIVAAGIFLALHFATWITSLRHTTVAAWHEWAGHKAAEREGAGAGR